APVHEVEAGPGGGGEGDHRSRRIGRLVGGARHRSRAGHVDGEREGSGRDGGEGGGHRPVRVHGDGRGGGAAGEGAAPSREVEAGRGRGGQGDHRPRGVRRLVRVARHRARPADVGGQGEGRPAAGGGGEGDERVGETVGAGVRPAHRGGAGGG